MKRKEPDRVEQLAPQASTVEAGVAANAQPQQSSDGAGSLQTVVRPSQGDIDAGVAIPVREYMKALVPSVQAGLTAFLKKKDANFKGTLAELPPLAISATAQKAFKNFREPWNMQNCVAALSSTQNYEASGNIFWLDVMGTKFGEHELTDADVTWRRLVDGAALWSEEAFLSSCEDAQYRRFIFPGYLPAVIASTSHVDAMAKAGSCHFSKLCVLGGHSILYAWYQALGDALAGGLDSRVLKLYEAGMTATIRLRLTASHTQVLADAHVWSETIRTSHMAGACDLLNFVKRIATMPEVIKKGTSAEKMRLVLASLGIVFKCKAVDKGVAMGIMALMSIVADDRCMQAVGPLRESFPKITNEMTKMMRLVQVCKSTWGEAAVRDRLSFCFQSLFVALMRGDVSEPETTTQWLVGTERGPGFLQLCGVKKTILDFMVRAVHLAVEHIELQQSSEAIVNSVLEKFSSPLAMHAAFRGKPNSTSACGDIAHPIEGEGEQEQEGTFETWMGSLTNKGAQAAAQLFYDIYIGAHDEARTFPPVLLSSWRHCWWWSWWWCR